jgi:hypothetical protein
LVNQGINPENIKIYSKDTEDSTSHRSGAILSTASVLEKIDEKLEKIWDQINIDTFKFWKRVNEGEVFSKLQEGIRKVKAYFGAEKEYGTIETDSGLDMFVKEKLIPEPQLVNVKFGDTYNLMRKYDSYYFNTFKLMRALNEYIINDFKIQIIQKEIFNYEDEEISESDYIFNCSGLANKDAFNNDKDILPIAGHIVTLKGQKIYDFDYVIYSHYIHKEDVGKYTYENAPLFYYMLKTDDKNFTGIFGGSLINNYSGGDFDKDECEYKGILRRAFEIFGQNSHASFNKLLPSGDDEKIFKRTYQIGKAKF